jgi:hypothetical protein
MRKFSGIYIGGSSFKILPIKDKDITPISCYFASELYNLQEER